MVLRRNVTIEFSEPESAGDKMVTVRCTQKEIDHWKRVSKAMGVSMSLFMRLVSNQTGHQILDEIERKRQERKHKREREPVVRTVEAIEEPTPNVEIAVPNKEQASDSQT